MAKKESKKERSISEVYDVLTDFFGFVKTQFEKVEQRFEKVEKHLDRHEKLLELVVQTVGHNAKDIKEAKETLKGIDVRQRHMEQDVLTIREDVETLSKITGRDSLTLKSHERRLVNLERSR